MFRYILRGIFWAIVCSTVCITYDSNAMLKSEWQKKLSKEELKKRFTARPNLNAIIARWKELETKKVIEKNFEDILMIKKSTKKNECFSQEEKEDYAKKTFFIYIKKKILCDKKNIKLFLDLSDKRDSEDVKSIMTDNNIIARLERKISIIESLVYISGLQPKMDQRLLDNLVKNILLFRPNVAREIYNVATELSKDGQVHYAKIAKSAHEEVIKEFLCTYNNGFDFNINLQYITSFCL